MKKFKDFIYDKNDIIIAVLILAVAALIIAWRLDVILQYPKQLINNDADTNVSEPADNSDNSSDNTDKPADNKDNSDDNADTPADNSGDGDNSNSGDNANNGDSTPAQESAQLWVGGKLSRDIEVDVTGTTASAAVQCLIDKGLFTDYSEYQKACENLGLNHEKVSAGTMTFTKGSTKADVARKINWS